MTTTPARPQPASPGQPARRAPAPGPLQGTGWHALQKLCVAIAVIGQGILAYAPFAVFIANPVLALAVAVSITVISAFAAYLAGQLWKVHRWAALALGILWALVGAALGACQFLVPDILPLDVAIGTTAIEYAQVMDSYRSTHAALAMLFAALYTGTGALTAAWAHRDAAKRHAS